MKTEKADNADGCTGQDIKGMFEEATRALERHAPAINQLNIFPVPDGDTGTNMLLTMRAAVEEARRCQDPAACAVSRAVARGALMGARGNSGVILSQVLRGMARALENKQALGSGELVAALSEASTAAYKGVSRPVEGTMLTVIREAATAVRDRASRDHPDVPELLRVAASAAEESVARTPALLPVLREAGVVDAGGQGLVVILRGMLRYLKGTESPEEDMPLMTATPRPMAWDKAASARSYGYCTEFLVEGRALEREQVRARLEKLGDSVMVVGDAISLRAHLHTQDPGAALSYATSLGAVHQVKVENIDDQHRDFLAGRRPKATAAGGVSTVAVVSGEGLTNVFDSLGISCVLPGGETMNPSVSELLQAIDSCPSDEVILLPNDANILPAAEQARSLSRKKVAVLSSKSIPQGIAALLAFNCAAGLEENIRSMGQAISTARTGQVTTAVQSMHAGPLQVNKGQAIGFSENEMVAAGDTRIAALIDLLTRMGAEKAGLVTLYYGADTGQTEVDEAAELLRRKFMALEVEVVFGGQPHYNYIVSLE